MMMSSACWGAMLMLRVMRATSVGIPWLTLDAMLRFDFLIHSIWYYTYKCMVYMVNIHGKQFTVYMIVTCKLHIIFDFLFV